MNRAPAELLHSLKMQHFSHLTMARATTSQKKRPLRSWREFTTSANHDQKPPYLKISGTAAVTVQSDSGCNCSFGLVSPLWLLLTCMNISVTVCVCRTLIPAKRSASLILNYTRFKKVALFFQIDHFAHPRERIFFLRE